ncbi:phage portal protein [Streptomyces sp. NPDC057253]|uniref:phage portal protein n=1 Tax=Streptomyces sp. NPDC057253 TaxID=3346069 RepID=UPI0036401606
MSFAFFPPNQRAAGSDLTISISPLGLVELSDQDFEIHGPRLNRYATNFAFYLGHHWAYRREAGEPQITLNYVATFARYINNFCFSKGVKFAVPKRYEHIVPALLKRVWEVDNSKQSLLNTIGEQGSVTGDSFVKVAYEPAWVDSAGGTHPGRVRILPLNSAHCFPEYHPHDRDRLVAFRLRYKFWTTGADGARVMMTYTERLTDTQIDEFLNDELIDSRPNPLGILPIAHIRNIAVSGSPWGLSDIGDIISINRELNEKMTDVSDIINYHASPTTIIQGAKATNLERGPRKIWGGLPEKAKVYNLENGVDLGGPMGYIQTLKLAMHEITGVPESALGQMQPISNTSGVALSIQWYPLINKNSLKQLNYGVGIKRINELVLRTLFCHEPETLLYDPYTDGIKTEDFQPDLLDPNDADVYNVDCVWPSPLPVDNLVKLNEIQAKLAIGLESKRNALVELGEEFPDERLEEMFSEQRRDVVEQGALELIKATISSAILQMTGIATEESGKPAPSSGGTPDQSGSPAGNAQTGVLPGATGIDLGVDTKSLIDQFVTMAYGTKLPQSRNSEDASNQETS